MYVCVCNALTERQVRSIIEGSGVGAADEVHAALSCERQCGLCLETLEDMVDAARCAFRDVCTNATC